MHAVNHQTQLDTKTCNMHTATNVDVIYLHKLQRLVAQLATSTRITRKTQTIQLTFREACAEEAQGRRL